MTKNLNSHFIVLLATFLVGGSFIVSQKISGIVDPISLTLLRFVIASICLLPFVVFKKDWIRKVLFTYKRAMIISFFYSVFFIGMFMALEYTNALNTGTIFTLTPLLTALLSIIFFKQDISIRQFVVYIFGIIGTCIVVFKGDLKLFLSLDLNEGDILFLFSIVSMAMYSISAKYFHKKDDELMILVFMTLIGGVIWMSLSLIIFDIPLSWEKIETNQFVNLLYLSIFATLGTSYLYQKATIVLGSKKVMSYLYLNPASIVILLVLFFEYTVSWIVISGIMISSIATVILLKREELKWKI